MMKKLMLVPLLAVVVAGSSFLYAPSVHAMNKTDLIDAVANDAEVEKKKQETKKESILAQAARFFGIKLNIGAK